MLKRKNKPINIFANVPKASDILLPDMFKETKDYIQLGYNKYSRHFVLTIFPENTWIRLVRWFNAYWRYKYFYKNRADK